MIQNAGDILEAMRNMDHKLLMQQMYDLGTLNEECHKLLGKDALGGIEGILEVTHDAFHILNPDYPDDGDCMSEVTS